MGNEELGLGNGEGYRRKNPSPGEPDDGWVGSWVGREEGALGCWLLAGGWGSGQDERWPAQAGRQMPLRFE
jgi:hypothetical protein